ncbi:MAG TPA: hypothetical protein PKI67_05820 [bacterium]|nr:hypothetical protein [bacterium]
MKSTIMYSLLCLIYFSPLAAQDEQGEPFIRNYFPQEYRAQSQNWSIVQDHRGLMYFGNNDGVLEFDGIRWRLSPLLIEHLSVLWP